MQKIKKGDDVIVISGKDTGKRGTVLKVVSELDRVVVENVNVVKKHQKPNPNAGVAGGIVEKEMSIHVSNVMLYNPQTKKGDRIGIRTLEDGKKVRYFKSTNEVVDA
jgi:large subunit ribosomal protein L24